ncbi:major tail protein [Turicibacter sanguinis]|uniref:major tail protein n=1 Tax=Turicibacter sanguinis TaxID=154288 RepID=UPI0006C71791|nr:major tail protein [Turicibacter sanguinis]CUN04209.1 phage major tail protein%2C phi13 family [Turicibacter sanguinis]
MAKVNKLLIGLGDIHFAPYVEGEFQTPVPITFAKKCEAKTNFEEDPEWADNIDVSPGFAYTGGEGTLTTLGLTAEEQVLLFGNTAVKGGVIINSSDVAPQGAFLFSRKKKKSDHKRLFVIYSCVCAPSALVNAETLEEGKGSAEEVEINFTVGQLEDGSIAFYVDTDSPTVKQEQVTNWFKMVQRPEVLDELNVLKTGKKD